MAEPASTTGGVTLTVLLISLLGPAAGPYALIVMASLLGAMWPMSVMPGITKRQGAFFLIRIVSAAVVLTGSAAWYLETHYSVPAAHGLAIVAFFIGALGNGWSPVLAALRGGITALARGIGGAAGAASSVGAADKEQ